MDHYLMQLDAKNRYEDFRREADMRRLVKRLKAHRRAPRLALRLSLGGILRRIFAGGRLLKSQV